VTVTNNERYLREMLSDKVSGSHMGLWLLVPEYLRLGSWDLIRGLFGNGGDLPARLAMQMVNESALCVNRVRKKDSLCHQGFSLVNGLSFLATDEVIHRILDGKSVSDYGEFQSALMKIRMLDRHYGDGERVFAIDPHRIGSTTKRAMVQKKKRPGLPSAKMMQTFFCNDTDTGQPLAFTLSASGKTCSQATLQLLDMVGGALGRQKALVLADKEHFTKEIVDYFDGSSGLDILMPAPDTKGIRERVTGLDYRELWPGYSLAETDFSFHNSERTLRLIVQKESAAGRKDMYKPFLTTSDKDPGELLSKVFSKRWTIEEFFNFEGDMGWNRASTFNINIRYGRQSLALLAQAAAFRLRKNLPPPYKSWTAEMLSEKVFTNMEGDIRVKGDTVIITYYKDHEILGLRDKYHNISQQLENENISPKIPWLYDYKLNFRFK
jgi:hypothetical protein